MSEPRCYTRDQVREKLTLTRRNFYKLSKKEPLCNILQECLPRIGRTPRYKADPIDRWMANQWQGPRAFRRAS